MGGRTWRSSRDLCCNGLLRKRDPKAGSNGWAPAQPSRAAPAPTPIPAPTPPHQPSPESHDFVYDHLAHEQISTSSVALPQPEQEGLGEAYSYYHPKSSSHRQEENDDAAGVPLPLSGSSSLRDLLKAEENHHVQTRRRFEIAKDFYGPGGGGGDGQLVQQRKKTHHGPAAATNQTQTRRVKEPRRQQSLFKQTMMAISKYTYM
ncbi:hypothetical protein CLAFUW4_09780 [Fulvia fulva]|uniref:Uncharacterized protein n=1 Tax=Passalora fulva TaxID=5499 RepID=A0A9Q8UU70_PASFU|nr:uncharacterized protein CLAFUR5_12458 [Fulvia fulva]KAK4615917.1 hypothetical protein CLAFUR4_09785 [Fulvia fulva]KAK4616437.1 hypothetical protein CLAFUR0_09778 [Fulvia fulva]UJO22616.1 hypothetical protein CLAFUR5_12458 [Fulvia fulva]WPV19636.1 hypothetical protein CLAFUW4_09780 [Fulvia fulva]WPV33860.1 hypothetical protein CLAFUW7_09783 [Fulvia fulva]